MGPATSLELMILLLFGACFAGVLLFGVVRFVRFGGVVPALARIRRRTIASIASAPEGMVTLEGTLSTRARITAPLSGREVAGYAVWVWTANEAPAYMMYAEATAVGDFHLEDDTGRALVRGQGAELHVKRPRSREQPLTGTPPEALRSALEHEGVDVVDLFSRAQLKVEEYLLLDGERVRVTGQLRHEPVPEGEAGYRTTATLPCLSSEERTVVVKPRGT